MMLIARLAVALALPAAASAQPAGRPVMASGNPILADGRTYSTDPAPVVDGDTLYILAGRDEAPDGVNDFIMHEWQVLATQDPASGRWTHHPAVARPETLFAWAEPSRAYAAQAVKGPNGRFYLYTSVLERDGDAEDRFAIGVAVGPSPRGPWIDAHPAGPILSQRTPGAEAMQNIDPTVLVDDDGRVFLYWGTFGQLRGIELERDMVTPKGEVVAVTSLTGFFEAPWLMKRRGVYYMLYAGNNAGPDSPCTPALYHACQAYGTATSPLGPWTYRGVVLPPVSSTTSHAGAVAFRGQWYLAYHTADAEGGGHFRRSVAIDPMRWDDSASPPRILPVVPSRRPQPAPGPTRNRAPEALASASDMPIPVQFWLNALNDGHVRRSPLPPDMWASWQRDSRPAAPWIAYRWPRPVTLDEVRIRFFADRPAGSAEGIAPPASWRLESWDRGRWTAVDAEGAYGTSPDAMQQVRFRPIHTRCVRAVFQASGEPGRHAGVGVQEWEALSPDDRLPEPAPDAVPDCGG